MTNIGSLYIHVPFCVRKCPYCAFYSRSYSKEAVGRYLDGLEMEIQWWKDRGIFPGPLKTIYIGGGTPSILTPCEWDRFIDIIAGHFTIETQAEVTVEANPDSVTPDLLSIWKNWYISRISLGVQSLDEHEIEWLNRPYSKEHVCKTLDMIKEYPFSLSCDLMFTIAGQTLRKWYENLSGLIHTWDPEHLSIYQLTLEHGTPWGMLPPEGITDGYGPYRFAQWYLPLKGYGQYEIASFAREEHICRHNLAYWYQENVIGLGPSAWGYLDGLRYSNAKELDTYLSSLRSKSQKGAWSYSEYLDNRKKAREAAILALRTSKGFNCREFRERFGSQSINEILDILDNIPDHLCCHKRDRVYLTSRGMRVANAIWEQLV